VVHQQPHERPLHERVREVVEKFAEDADLTTAEIAKQAGWSERRLARLLEGTTQLRGTDIEVLARIVGMPEQALFHGAARRRAS
jgi:hypothetical protein